MLLADCYEWGRRRGTILGMQQLKKTWLRIVGSFWFRPLLLALGGLLLAETIVRIDLNWGIWRHIGSGTPLGADGARGLLTAVAGSIIGVAATSFSITMSVLATASSSYGSRLVQNFMKDERNQLTLGYFSAVFLYALWVLRYIRNDENGDQFVPHLAIFVAMGLAIIAVAVLIYFIHHIADSIQVSTLLATLRQNLQKSIAGVTRARDIKGLGLKKGGTTPKTPHAYSVTAEGYIQSIDYKTVSDLAKQHSAFVDVVVRPGEYVYAGLHGFRSSAPIKGEDLKRLVQTISTAATRNHSEDIHFAFQQPIDMALRAMSPGINDPFTAVNAMNTIEPKLIRILTDTSWDKNVFLEKSSVRMRVALHTSDDLLQFVCESLRTVAYNDPNTTKAFREMLMRLQKYANNSQKKYLQKMLVAKK